jgi:L-seryl-tRNA(Ser) seleniumtransferase
MDDKRKEMLRGLPKIDEVIMLLDKSGINDLAPREIVLEVCRNVVQNLRDKIIEAKDRDLSKLSLDAASAAGIVEQAIQGFYRYHLVRVVNATGVILHTNLGRAPLCPEALQRILK